MKKTLATLFILTSAIISAFALEVKVGASFIDDNKFSMQVARYNGIEIYSGDLYRYMNEDGEIIYGRYVKKGYNFKNEDLGNVHTDPSFGVQDNGSIGLFSYDYSLSLSTSLRTNEMTNLRGSANVGISNGKVGAYASINKEYYSLFNGKMTEDITEVGITLRLREDLFKFVSIESEVGAYLYPTFELSNIETSTFREDTFSTRLYAKAVLDMGFLRGHIGAGITSWQIPPKDSEGLVGSFVPVQIRNLFDAGVEVDLGKVGFFFDYAYFCDHPEVCWERIVTWDIYTNNVYGLTTCGITLEI